MTSHCAIIDRPDRLIVGCRHEASQLASMANGDHVMVCPPHALVIERPMYQIGNRAERSEVIWILTAEQTALRELFG